MTAPLKVIIAGGGIAGLTLANALEQANIDYVLLERRNEIAPQVGASILLLANGCRVLDQLGCTEALHKCTEPVIWAHDRDQHGRPLAQASRVSQLMKARSGYPFTFSDRQNVLRVLYGNLKDKSRILEGKNLTTVRQHTSGVTVICEDGTSYTGDILAGADGVNSKARSEMWRLADEVDPELVKNDKTSLESQYQCLYGIASSSCGLPVGEIDVGYHNKRSSLILAGKNDRSYYFVFEKMDKVYKPPHVPRFTEADRDEFAKRNGDMKVREDICFGDIHKNMVTSTLVAIETATYKIWTWGRIACLGDSAHKMTPNAGFGGNAAIESAAALANSIKKLSDISDGQRPTEQQIIHSLQSYQKGRGIRATAAIEASTFLTGVHALATWAHALFVRYGLSILGDFFEGLSSDMSVGATLIEYLPPPEISLVGHMPFNPEQGQGHKENLFFRALLASPFLVLVAFAWKFANLNLLLEAGGGTGQPWHNSLKPSSLINTTAGRGGQNNKTAILQDMFTAASINSDPAAGLLFANLLAYSGLVLAIWSVEAVRRCNAMMPVQLPAMFAFFAQRKCLGMVAPVYYFLHVMTPIDSFKSTDMRLTQMHYTRAILPSLLMVYYLPLLQSYLLPETSQRQTWLQLWQWFPITHSLAQFAISKILKDTTDSDKIHAPKGDVSTIRYTIGIPTIISIVVWLRTVFSAPVTLSQIFLPQPWTHVPTSLTEIMQWNYLLAVSSSYLWLLYFAWDAKAAGMMTYSWITLLAGRAASTIVLGPGGAIGVGFLYREYIITEKRHKGALTVESVRKRAAAGKS
ncbi:FAD/NAD(P)-binding domain-containing protein [Aureobasidium melanogenum CBS 110374]|uniref:FAD/NAD(P)-binding domain-containing protein n=1 Tax=Aureobasidium melanogenum (strain CBS 110374) TaxID=1043003 RepID=A0A074VE83_AURM1|nr:FAD/NAD(P)-binding domain-containing protein [Aureobasidium melanogenum CBS 110374]KEQ58673.1 FAD/NAD(P)-binding domain-containing protein [Aureobasidium melanogenum CBS 110374]